MTREGRPELERALRLSRRALPIELGFTVAASLILWVAWRQGWLASWVAIGLGVLAAIGAVADAVNIPYVKARLRRLGRPGHAGREPRGGA